MASVLTPKLGLCPAVRCEAVLTRQATTEELPKCSASQPVIAQRFNRGQGGLYLLLSCAQEVKDTKLHGVIVQLTLTDDALMKREEDVLVVARAVFCALHLLQHRAHGGTNPHTERIVRLLGAAKLRSRAPCSGLSLVKEWDRKLKDGANFPRPVFPLSARTKRGFREKRCRAAHTKRFTGRNHLLPGACQVNTCPKRSRLKSLDGQGLCWHRRKTSFDVPGCLLSPEAHEDV